MTVAPTAEVAPGWVLSMVDKRLKAPCDFAKNPTESSVIGNCYGDSTSTGYGWNSCNPSDDTCNPATNNPPVTISFPENTLVPTTVIGGPSNLGVCDDLELDASGSMGNGGRPFTKCVPATTLAHATGHGSSTATFWAYRGLTVGSPLVHRWLTVGSPLAHRWLTVGSPLACYGLTMGSP